ncbi:ATP-binding cassette domain-containing protein, partial [Lactobacillus nasalidis]
MPKEILKVDHLSVNYGAIKAVRDVSFDIKEGEIVTLIGANGAGKSTILKTISGLLKPANGEIVFLGESLAKLSAPKIVAAGVSQVPEGRRIFAGM